MTAQCFGRPGMVVEAAVVRGDEIVPGRALNDSRHHDDQLPVRTGTLICGSG